MEDLRRYTPCRRVRRPSVRRAPPFWLRSRAAPCPPCSRPRRPVVRSPGSIPGSSRGALSGRCAPRSRRSPAACSRIPGNSRPPGSPADDHYRCARHAREYIAALSGQCSPGGRRCTNWTARAASRTPRTRESTLAPVSPKSRMTAGRGATRSGSEAGSRRARL